MAAKNVWIFVIYYSGNESNIIVIIRWFINATVKTMELLNIYIYTEPVFLYIYSQQTVEMSYSIFDTYPDAVYNERNLCWSQILWFVGNTCCANWIAAIFQQIWTVFVLSAAILPLYRRYSRHSHFWSMLTFLRLTLFHTTPWSEYLLVSSLLICMPKSI